eukprot:CAMPEP_0115017742 /NCGR_PEP_ID=MMETSP0216-20121206/28324_1 /TAXON_ID=223996 /ORGANISM="Protocruzia adherens, Strain Boccale" /LENGTH=234 /DNA_ID=CAMNT_0002388669 /DNA_START=61 /DNA_END=765 /DNA_ORIENTATION=-
MASNNRESDGNRRSISTDEWEDKLQKVKIPKSDINMIVMNYLIKEGYKEAAEIFQRESGTDVEPHDLGLINSRMEIREAVQRGDIETAIDLVNNLNPEVLDKNSGLYFSLEQQKFIELLKADKQEEALLFAQESLAQKAEENPEFLPELEKTMCLLGFNELSQSPMSHLVENSQRQKVASELNAAILDSFCLQKDSILPTLLKLLLWSQNRLKEKVEFPEVTDIARGKLEHPSE